MDLGLVGKTAIVTGGSAGIGRACAAALHDEGVHVALVARDPVRLKDAAAAIAASFRARTQVGAHPITGRAHPMHTAGSSRRRRPPSALGRIARNVAEAPATRGRRLRRLHGEP